MLVTLQLKNNICIHTVQYGPCYRAFHGSYLGLVMQESVGIFFMNLAPMASYMISWATILTFYFIVIQTGKLSFNDPYKIVRLEIDDQHRFEEALQKASS